MAIRKRGDSWQIDLFVPTGQKDEEGRDIKQRIRKSFSKKKDAQAEHDKMKTLVRENRYLDVKKDYRTTLGELLEKYEENFRHQKAYNSKAIFLKNFRGYFGEEIPLANIRYVDLETYRNHVRNTLSNRGAMRTDATTNRETSCLHHVFEKAVEWEIMEYNPFSRGKSLKLKENNERKRWLREDEIERLLKECSHIKHLHRIVTCALNTGMRRGEILSLKWPQVRDGFIYLKETKTKNPREIPINEDLDAVLKEIRREQGLSSEYVFTYARRKIVYIDRAFHGALRRAGIEDFHFHDLRHTFASHLVMKGATIKEVQELLGHKNIKTTMRYAHLADENKRKAVNLLNGLTRRPVSQNVTFLRKSG